MGRLLLLVGLFVVTVAGWHYGTAPCPCGRPLLSTPSPQCVICDPGEPGHDDPWPCQADMSDAVLYWLNREGTDGSRPRACTMGWSKRHSTNDGL